MDLIEQFAYPLPVIVICEMLGVPVADHERFKGWGLDIARGLDAILLPPDSPVAERSMHARHALAAYFRELIAARRAAPRDDMLSGLIAAEEAGDKLSEDELLATCILLLVAGHETTVNLIGNGVLALLRHPDQLAALRDDPALVTGAVDELLRYDSPVQMTRRVTLAETTVGGKTIEPGAFVVLGLASANRDPAHFGADADRLDLTRPRAGEHLSFGGGHHYCLGASLARLEAQIAVGTLVQRFATIEAAAEPEWNGRLNLRGLQRLPLILGR